MKAGVELDGIRGERLCEGDEVVLNSHPSAQEGLDLVGLWAVDPNDVDDRLSKVHRDAQSPKHSPC